MATLNESRVEKLAAWSRLLTTVRIVFIIAIFFASPAATQSAIPEALEPWVPWVLEKHHDLRCPLVAGERLCVWPGRMQLDLDDRGGRFELEAMVDREVDLTLPGDAAHWPREVRDNDRAALMRRLDDRPTVHLVAGRHRLSGVFRWRRLPESLPVPALVGLIDLRLREQVVRFPRREPGGLLWLAASAPPTAEDRLSIEVGRRIDDGVPVVLTTRLRLEVSGGARTVDLGAPLPAGFAPTRLSGELPMRWTADERLEVQVRAGVWQIVVEARSRGPVERLAMSDRPAPWPATELWAFRADPSVRSLRLSGAPGIDPQRTSLPDAWKPLPVFQLSSGGELRFAELHRGDAAPPPDVLQVRRTWWLEQSGDRFSVRDILGGTLFQGGRLQAAAPAELGRVAIGTGGGLDQLITLGPAEPAGPGVEVRDGELVATAELWYRRGGALPAVGWNRDAQLLAIDLHLPPGWTLIAASGSDRAKGAWLDRWTLLDLFLVLMVSLATWRLDGRLWGTLALAFLIVGWHEAGMAWLAGWWLALLPLRALLRVLPTGGGAAGLARGARWLLLIAFSVQLIVFCAEQWRTGLFPQLEPPSSASVSVDLAAEIPKPKAAMVEEQLAPETPAERHESYARPRPKRRLQVDANALVQTGPGLPSWQWQRASLLWNGPVAADQQVRLWLLSPRLELLLSLLRIAMAVLLAFCLIHPRRTPGALARGGRSPASAAVLALLWLVVMTTLAVTQSEAQEGTSEQELSVPGSMEPSDRLLRELERRLTAPAACQPSCVELSHLAIIADASGLSLSAEVHVAAPAAWPLPGPATTWTPSSVRVDGEAAVGLRLADDGFFLLRLAPGVHRVELRGPAGDSLALQLPLAPRSLDWRGDGWTIAGWRADESPPGTLRLDRQIAVAAAESGGEAGAQALEPWLELRRELDIGLTWRVHSELRRRGDTGTPVLARVPLLAGESVTTADIEVIDGQAEVRLQAEETSLRFSSLLDERDSLTLTAASDHPWLERWQLDCSPVWHCRATGLAPSQHMQEGVWRPVWQPWPGEQVTFAFLRPPGAPGQTFTIDRAELRWAPGRRLLTADVELELRSSRGGERRLRLPTDAALQSFEIDGRGFPVQADDGVLSYTLEPGEHHLKASWRQSHGIDFYERLPLVSLVAEDGDEAQEAVNVSVVVEVPADRWLLWAGGPGWGPVVEFWQYLLVLALAAWALGRWAPTPLTAVDWLLLGAGLTQVPLVAALVVVGWFLALAWRDHLQPRRFWTYDFLQLAFFGLGLTALGSFYAAVRAGLLVQPDMQVVGLDSYGSTLSWYVDRVRDTLPRPWLLWLPLWVWRLLMLLWSLWLASRLLRWLPWCWRCLAVGPLLAGPKAFRAWRASQHPDDPSEAIDHPAATVE